MKPGWAARSAARSVGVISRMLMPQQLTAEGEKRLKEAQRSNKVSE
jgi:hypothetical protein